MTRALLALLLPACAATYPGAAEDYAEAQRATVARERATADALQGVLHEIRDRPLVEPAALEAAVAALRAEASEASGTSRTERSRLQDASTALDGRLGALERLVAAKVAEAEAERDALRLDRAERKAYREHQHRLEAEARAELKRLADTLAVPLARAASRLDSVEGRLVDQRAVLAALQARPAPWSEDHLKRIVHREIAAIEGDWLRWLKDQLVLIVMGVALLAWQLIKARRTPP